MKKILALPAFLLFLVASMGSGIADTHGQNETTDMVSQVTGETTPTEPPSPPPPPPPPFLANKPPVAEAGPNQTVYVDELTHFSGAGSSDPDGIILFYDWDFGDGTTASGMNVSHAYSEPGIYTANLTVMDDRIADGSDTCTITVRGTLPVPPPPPPPPLPPVLDNLTIIPAELELGDNVTISLDIMNIDNQSITYAIDIHIENVNDPPPTWPPMDVYLRIWVDLEAYESKTVSQILTPETVGYYNVTVHGMTESFMVEAPDIPLKQAEFEISELEALGRQALIHDDEGRPILEGEYVIFSVLVINIGETEGTYTVEFKVDGKTTDIQTMTLLAGRGHRAHVYYEALNAGTYQVSVGDLTEAFTVRALLEPAEFKFSNLQITPKVKIGMSVNISVDVTNVGEEMGFCTFELKLNGRVVDSVEIPSFGGGVTATQFFELTRGEGTYEVEVEGLTGSFNVFTTPEPPFWTSPEFVMVVSVIIAATVILYAYWKGILPSATTRSSSKR